MSEEACPVPIGWTVRVYRTAPTDEIARGIEILATHEDGRKIHDYARKQRVPDGTPTLLSAGTSDWTVEQSETTAAAFLWRRVKAEIGRQECAKRQRA